MNVFRRAHRTISRLPEWFRLLCASVAAIGFFGVGAALLWALFIPIPSISNFESRQVAQSTKIYDRTGSVVLYDVHGSVRRTSVPLTDISPYVQHATISIEDDTFYQHHGFRPLAFLRAVLVQLHLYPGYAGQGGSTITQQVVKNALLTQDKNIIRKLQEIVLALRLERIHTKDEILETYLNENPYGGTIYGVQEASQYFFGVDAKDVDIAQAAYLAALPQAPTYYSPYGNHREALDTRKNLVLARMKELGYINDDEYTRAKQEQVQFRQETEAGIKAPHFVFYVREYLENKYGADTVANGGLRVITTLDYDLQENAEATVSKWAPQMQTNFNAHNEGMVAIEPSSGQILAMVGSRGYFDDTIQGKVNVTTSLQEPGSSFKPFVYAAALEKGYTPDTIVFDIPTQFSTLCQPQDVNNSTPPCYAPTSFDGKFKGPVTFRSALAQSLNIPAVKALYLTGIDAALNMAQRMGITTLTDRKDYGLSLVLGGGAVTPLEMTAAYAVFANDGVRTPPVAILRVEDAKGKVLEEYQDQSARVMDQQVARQINNMLADNTARIPEFGADSPLYFPGYNVAAKTGTTNDYWDVWILGYTPGISVGAWAGNNDNTPLQKNIAAFIIAPMWHEFMAYAIDKYPSDNFTPPAPDTAGDSLPPVLRGNWNGNPSQGVHDILYWINKDSPRSGQPSNPYSDPQAAYWDYPVSLWASGQNLPTGVIPSTAGGTSTSGSGLTITSPEANSYVQSIRPVTLSASYPNPGAVRSVSYFVNGAPVGTATAAPYGVSYAPQSRGQAVLQAVASLTDGGTVTTQIIFTIQ